MSFTQDQQTREKISSFQQPLSEILQKVSPEKADGFIAQLSRFLEEQGDNESRIERLTAESARKQFFKAIYE